MKSFVALALAATAFAIPQSSTPPSGCQASTSGSFQISTVNVTSPKKRGLLESRQLAGALTLSLQNGKLKDQAGRTGYIASNYQFQFDAPVQANAREQSGFSVCSNGSLALNNGRPSGAAVWFSCLSGTFYNLYSQSTGAQCIPIYIVAVNQGGGSGASQISDGQPQVTQPPVSQISDGQPQASTPRPVVSQISDGQPQASSPRPVVSQISDGQPQAPSPARTSSRAPVVSQISDGQPQAPSPARTSSRAPVVSQISDGQPQAPAPTTRAPVVSQISDGQPQAGAPTNGTIASTSRSAPAQFTGAAPTGQAAAGAFAAGVLGLLALL